MNWFKCSVENCKKEGDCLYDNEYVCRFHLQGRLIEKLEDQRKEISTLKDKLQETHKCCINYANKLNIAKDKLHRRNMIITDLRRHLEESDRHNRDLRLSEVA